MITPWPTFCPSSSSPGWTSLTRSLQREISQHQECQQCLSSSFICGWYRVERNVLKHKQFYLKLVKYITRIICAPRSRVLQYIILVSPRTKSEGSLTKTQPDESYDVFWSLLITMTYKALICKKTTLSSFHFGNIPFTLPQPQVVSAVDSRSASNYTQQA